MNRIQVYWVLSLLCLMPFSSCRKESVGRQEMREIHFAFHLPGSSSATKVSYYDNQGRTWEYNGKQSLYWKIGDMVRIAAEKMEVSPTGRKWLDYINNDASMYGEPFTALEGAPYWPAEYYDDWALPIEDTLYAVYPSPRFLEGKIPYEIQERLSVGAGGFMTGYIPPVQQPVPLSGSNELVANMDYAYMYATYCTSWAIWDEWWHENLYAELYLEPLFTAIEFEICASDAHPVMTLTGMELSGSGLAGMFSCQLSAKENAVNKPESGTEDSITIDFTSVQPGGCQVTMANPLKFTVLAVGCDHTSLTLSLTGDEIGTRSLLLRDKTTLDPLTFQGGKKYLIHGLSIPN